MITIKTYRKSRTYPRAIFDNDCDWQPVSIANGDDDWGDYVDYEPSGSYPLSLWEAQLLAVALLD